MPTHSVFFELRFWLMVAVSLVLPCCIYAGLLARRTISPVTALVLGLTLVAIAGLDVFVLQSLAAASRLTPSLADDAVFASEMSLALYLFPAMFGGIGVNILSHVLMRHLVEAERRFAEQHPDT